MVFLHQHPIYLTYFAVFFFKRTIIIWKLQNMKNTSGQIALLFVITSLLVIYLEEVIT